MEKDKFRLRQGPDCFSGYFLRKENLTALRVFYKLSGSMKNPFIALLLSMFIFPGVGQIYKGEVRKGVFLLLAASLLLAVLVLGFFMLYSYAYSAMLSQATSPDAIDPAQLQHLLISVVTHPFILFTFGLLLATWVFGIIDAARRTGQNPGR
jgi:TM2 domain-containing membrane protein YozV